MRGTTGLKNRAPRAITTPEPFRWKTYGVVCSSFKAVDAPLFTRWRKADGTVYYAPFDDYKGIVATDDKISRWRPRRRLPRSRLLRMARGQRLDTARRRGVYRLGWSVAQAAAGLGIGGSARFNHYPRGCRLSSRTCSRFRALTERLRRRTRGLCRTSSATTRWPRECPRPVRTSQSSTLAILTYESLTPGRRWASCSRSQTISLVRLRNFTASRVSDYQWKALLDVLIPVKTGKRCAR